MSKKQTKNIEEYKLSEDILELAIDTHCHLDRYEFRQEIVDKIKEFGIKKLICMTGEKEAVDIIEPLAHKNEGVYYALGIHPFEKEEMTKEYEQLMLDKKADKKFVAVGEIGLDYSREPNEEDKQKQKEVFVWQLKLANAIGRPVCLHIRGAHEDAIKLLKENKHLLTHGGVVHCYSGDTENTKEYLSLGFHISFAGNISYKKKEYEPDLVESLKIVPLEKLLIETDSPFLSPMPYRGQQNQPKMVVVTGQFVADVLNMNVNELIKITTINAEKLFNLN